MSASDSFGKLILRLSLGGLVLFHGVAKVTNMNSLKWIGGELAKYNLPDVIAYGVYLGEVVGPVLIILGLLTRLGALMIAVNMAAAVALLGMDNLMVINQYGGWQLELEGIYFFAALALMFMGSGRYAVLPDRR